MQVFLFYSVTAPAESNVEIIPQNPKPQDTVTFNVTITNVENIKKVVIIVKECGNEPGYGYICYTDGFNETMTAINNETYTAQVKLNHKNAIELKYRLGYLTDNRWTWEPLTGMVKVELDTSSNSTDTDDKGSSIPGFEIIFLVFSVIFILLILNTRRR